jgi:hypothetical protein
VTMLTRQSSSNKAGRLNNVDVVLLATYFAGGSLRAIDTEDIAVAAHKFDPTRFSWRKYPDQIDIERVRVRLSQARVQKQLAGVHSEGWRLTPLGVRYVRDVLLLLVENHPKVGALQKQSVRKVDRAWIAAERRRLLGTRAYAKYESGNPSGITRVEIGEFFRVDEYMNADVVREKLERLAAAFENDRKLGPVVTYLAQKVSEIS